MQKYNSDQEIWGKNTRSFCLDTDYYREKEKIKDIPVEEIAEGNLKATLIKLHGCLLWLLGATVTALHE